MNILLIGNAVSMVGCFIMVAIGFLKKKSHILIAQSVQCAFMGAGNLILGGVSGFIANVVSMKFKQERIEAIRSALEQQ